MRLAKASVRRVLTLSAQSFRNESPEPRGSSRDMLYTSFMHEPDGVPLALIRSAVFR
jgi:hypothetical protein